MNRWLERLDAYYNERVKERIEKLTKEMEEAERSFNDTGYYRYDNVAQRREAEIDEIKRCTDKNRMRRYERMYMENKQKYRDLLAKVIYLLYHVEPCDKVSYANLNRAQQLLRDYEDVHILSDEFKSRTGDGRW